MTGARVFFYALANYNTIGSAPTLRRRQRGRVGRSVRRSGGGLPAGGIRHARIVDLQQKGKLRRHRGRGGPREEPDLRPVPSSGDASGRRVRRRPARLPRRLRPCRRPRPGGRTGADAVLILGFDAAVDFPPVVGSDNTSAQLLQVEQGVYENGAWKQTARAGPPGIVRSAQCEPCPAQGAIYRVRLMRIKTADCNRRGLSIRPTGFIDRLAGMVDHFAIGDAGRRSLLARHGSNAPTGQASNRLTEIGLVALHADSVVVVIDAVQ